MAVPKLDPVTAAQFDVSEGRIKRQYGLGMGQNKAQRNALALQYAGQIKMYNGAPSPHGGWAAPEAKKWQQAKDQLHSGLAASGLKNSGIAQQGQYDLSRASTDAYAEVVRQYMSQYNPLMTAQNQLGTTRTGQLGDLGSLKTAQRAAISGIFGGA